MGVVLTLLAISLLCLSGYAAAKTWFWLPVGLPALLGGMILAWSWLTIGTLGLGLLAHLDRLPLLIWTSVGCLPVLHLLKRQCSLSLVSDTTTDRIGLEAGLAFGLSLWAIIALGAQSLVFPPVIRSDGPIYHLYFAAKWWKAGHIFLIPTPFGESAAPYFPAIGDLWLTWLFVIGGGDTLAKLGQYPFLLVTGLTVYALARRLGGGRSSSLMAVCFCLTATAFLVYSSDANVDTIFVAGYLLATYFGTLFVLKDQGSGALVLAALAAGLAWGCKAPGVIFVPPLLALGGLLVLVRTEAWSLRLRNLAILGLVPFVHEGFWLVRNFMLTGNPLYPLHLTAFGRTILAGWYGTAAMPTSKYYMPVHDLAACVDTLVAAFDPRLALFWLSGLVGLWQIGRPKSPENKVVWGISGLTLLNIALFWFLIPYRTQQRFLFHAIALAAIPLAMLLSRSKWLRWVTLFLMVVHMLTPQGWPISNQDRGIPWDLSPVVPNASLPAPLQIVSMFARQPQRADGRGMNAGPWISQAKLLIGLAIIGWGVWSVRRPFSHRRTTIVLGIAAIALIGASLQVLVIEQSDPRVRRYPGFADHIAGWMELDLRTPPQGARIAYAGTNLPYVLMGPDQRNDVRYVNIDSHRDWLLHDYHLAAESLGLPKTWIDTRTTWDRANPDYAAWLANLRAERIQLLVVTRADPEEGRLNPVDRERFTIERVWADSHPEAFNLVYQDPLFRVYGVVAGKK